MASFYLVMRRRSPSILFRATFWRENYSARSTLNRCFYSSVNGNSSHHLCSPQINSQSQYLCNRTMSAASPDVENKVIQQILKDIKGVEPGKILLSTCPKCGQRSKGIKTVLVELHKSGDTASFKCKECRMAGDIKIKRTVDDCYSCISEAELNKFGELDRFSVENTQAIGLFELNSVSDNEDLISDIKVDARMLEKVELLSDSKQNTPENNFLDMRSISDSEDPTLDEEVNTEMIEKYALCPLSDQIYEFFTERHISRETLLRNKVMEARKNQKVAIAFTYSKNHQITGCKYRTLDKHFSQDEGAEKIPYGLDDIKNTEDIIIVEGEIDKLSLEEAGFKNCISVLNHASSPALNKDLQSPREDKKYSYLWNFKDIFGKAKRIILATDSDEAGQALAEEIARRVGRERCWRVSWPFLSNNKQCKDANEVLMSLGTSVLKGVIEKAELWPIRGLLSFTNFFSEIDSYYHCHLENEVVVSTGWKTVDNLYKVVPGELTLVTGVPNSGKSEWIDALLCNLNYGQGWKFVLCSMENKVHEHARKFLEKHIKKPFFNARYAGTEPRMSHEDLEEGKAWLDDTFCLIRCEDDIIPSIEWVLDLAKSAVLRHGVHGLVIDPYNELDHQRNSNSSETEYVSKMMTMMKRFAQFHNCHVWFVAHPRQLHDWKGDAPSIYDISGSAHFINKCDNMIVVHRNLLETDRPSDQIQIHVRKVRNKVAGKIGSTGLHYNRVTGTYEDIAQEN